MKVLIKHLGSIKNNKQTIDLTKKFYVFVGDNNSGKTYVSQLLWTIFNPKVISKFSDVVTLNISFESVNSFNIDQPLIDGILIEFANFLKNELANTYNIENTSYRDTVLEKLHLSFSYDFDKIIEKDVQVISNISSIEKNKRYDFFTLKKEKNSPLVIFEDKDISSLFETASEKRIEKINADKPNLKKASFVSAIIKLLLNQEGNSDILFLPASRTFYSTFYQYIYEFEREQNDKFQSKFKEVLEDLMKNKKEISSEILNDALGNVSNRTKRPYSEPINELFRKLYNLNKNIELSPYYENLVEKVTNLMGGDIVMSSTEGVSMNDFLFKINTVKKELPMYMSSSSVNQLTLLYLYLKYWTKEEGNFLMIDEPEQNLNPKNQIKILEILIEFATQKNNKVLITTHSPVLAESVNNYLYVDALKEVYKMNIATLIEDNNLTYINPDISISTKDLAVYFFSGKDIIDYGSPDYNVYFKDFKDVSSAVERNNLLLSDIIYLKGLENNE